MQNCSNFGYFSNIKNLLAFYPRFWRMQHEAEFEQLRAQAKLFRAKQEAEALRSLKEFRETLLVSWSSRLK